MASMPKDISGAIAGWRHLDKLPGWLIHELLGGLTIAGPSEGSNLWPLVCLAPDPPIPGQKAIKGEMVDEMIRIGLLHAVRAPGMEEGMKVLEGAEAPEAVKQALGEAPPDIELSFAYQLSPEGEQVLKTLVAATATLATTLMTKGL